MTKMTKGAYELVGVVEKHNLDDLLEAYLRNVSKPLPPPIRTHYSEDFTKELKGEIHNALLRGVKFLHGILILLTTPFWIWSYKSKR